MPYRHTVITRFQLFTLVVNTMIATGIYTLARTVADVAGRGAIISIPLAGLLSLLQLWGMYLLAIRFPKRSITEYAPEVLGKIPAKFYFALYALVSALLSIMVCRNYWLVTAAWVLKVTPQIVFLWLLVLVCWNTARRGIVVLSRISEIAFMLTVPIAIVYLIPFTAPDLDYLRPVLDRGVGSIVKGVLPAYFSMTGFDIFLIAFPFAEKKTYLRPAVTAITLVTVFYTLLVAVVISSLSLPLTLTTAWPLQQLLNRITAPIIDRVDVVLLILWSIQVIMTVMIPMFMAATLLRGVFPVLSMRRAVDLITLLILAAVAVPIMLPTQNAVVEYFSYSHLVVAGSLPWVIWLIAVLRRKGGQLDDEVERAA